MTEAILASSSNLLQYLTKHHKLDLSKEQVQDVEFLWQRDKALLGQILYRFDNHTFIMKRRHPQQQSNADFVEGIKKAAKRWKAKSSAEAGEVSAESYDQSDASLDEIIAKYKTPNTSQVDNPSNSASSGETGDVDQCSPATTQATSEGSQDSAPTRTQTTVSEECDAEQGDLYKQLSFAVKFMLATLKTSRPLSNSIYTSADVLKQFRNLGTRAAMVKWLQSSSPDLRSDASTFVSPAFLEACEDLDKEDEMLRDGSKYLHLDKEGWYGGKVSFSGKVTFTQQGSIQARLRPYSIKTSSRFTRRFGSSRFLRLDVPKLYESDKQRNEVIDYLNKPFYVLDRCFNLLCIKEKESRERSAFGWTATFFECGEDIPSIWHFYNWHGPWKDNANGKLCKYMQRLFLGLSTSNPSPFIPTENVRYINDIISPIGEVMTDGAAPISRGAMIKIALALGLTAIPTAVQGRYDGAKGMWYLDPESGIDEVWIATRPSQIKLHRAGKADTSQQTFDVLNVAKVITPSTLSLQILFVLSHNGVSCKTLIEMQKEQLQEIIDNLFGPEGGKKDGLELAKSLDEAAGVYFSRARRNATHVAATRGLLSRAEADHVDRYVEDDAEMAELDDAGAEYQTVQERAYDMSLAGFELDKSYTMMDLYVKVAKTLLDRSVKDWRIRVPQSAELYVIPDPLGVLKEGEVQIRFGPDAPVDPDTMMRMFSLTGDVLVTRHPCLTPVDIQKVKAVVYPELASHIDVIVISTKGDRPLVSLLSGGDCDGDTIRVYWGANLVQPFQNASIERCQPSITIADVFNDNIETVADLLECKAQRDRLKQLINTPLRSPGSKGQYGMWQRVAAYTKGCSSQEAIDLAFKFNNSMDGVKTGLTIKDDILRQDRRAYNLTMPNWANKDKISNLEVVLPQWNLPPDAKRDRKLGRCIVDILYDAGITAAGKLKGDLEARQQALGFRKDVDIINHWEEAVRKETITPLQISLMEEHCRSILSIEKRTREQYGILKRDKERAGSVSPSKKSRVIDSPVKGASPAGVCGSPCKDLTFAQIPQHYRDWINDDIKAFEMAGLQPDDYKDLKLSDVLDDSQMSRLNGLLASCLYIGATRSRYSEKVAFDIAGQELLNIKAIEKNKRLEQIVSVKHHQPIVVFSRSTAHALRIGKIL